MKTECTKIVVGTAAIALLLAVSAAGSYAVSADAAVGPQAIDARPVAMSTMVKNKAWPIKGNISMQPCLVVSCEDV